MKVLLPLPDQDFDPTETAIPWKVLTQAGHEVVFATPEGGPGRCDDRMITGRGLGPWSAILRAREDAREAYEAMARSPAFLAPVPYASLPDPAGVVLPGGHAPGMKVYLESKDLQRFVGDFFRSGRPVGAICHGVVLAARSGILGGKRATALTANMEMTAWGLTALWLGSYYRTYPETVQEEVTRALGEGGRFETGPFAVARDSLDRLDRGFVVRDGNLLTARWPGDAYRFATDFAGMLTSPSPAVDSTNC